MNPMNIQVTDRKTGKVYCPAEEWARITNSEEFIAQMKRMKDEKGIGWPVRVK